MEHRKASAKQTKQNVAVLGVSCQSCVCVCVCVCVMRLCRRTWLRPSRQAGLRLQSTSSPQTLPRTYTLATTMGRPPVTADFPSNLHLSIVPRKSPHEPCPVTPSSSWGVRPVHADTRDCTNASNTNTTNHRNSARQRPRHQRSPPPARLGRQSRLLHHSRPPTAPPGNNLHLPPRNAESP